MSSEEEEVGEEDEVEGEEEEEKQKSQKGEDDHLFYPELQIQEEIVQKCLTYKEASSCLHMLGKDETGCRYAYLMITATDRELTELSILLQFVHVLFLDLGGNNLDLESLQILDKMPYLIYLKVDRNRIQSVELRPFTLLQVLNVSKNKIMRTKNIRQPLLETLDLNYNFIDIIDIPGNDVPKLKQLELRGNLLNTFQGIYPPTIESLYLAENRIDKLDEKAFESLVNLKVLHLRENLLKKLTGFTPKLTKLMYLNIRKNRIETLRQIGKLGCLPALEILVMHQNPVSGDLDEEHGEGGDEKEIEEEDEEEELGEGEEALDKFRVTILVLLPNLKRLNKKTVTSAERAAAELQRYTRYVEIMGETSEIDDDEDKTEYEGEYEESTHRQGE